MGSQRLRAEWQRAELEEAAWGGLEEPQVLQQGWKAAEEEGSRAVGEGLGIEISP